MAGEFFILTFGPGGEPGEAGDLIPLGLIEQHFRPFMTRHVMTNDTDHEALLVYPVVRLNSGGVWEQDTSARGDAVNEAEMSYTTSASDSGLVNYIDFAHHPDHPAFEAGIHALLASASAVAIQPDGIVPVIGRAATLANLPPDLIESLGTPHLAHTAGDLWTVSDDALNAARARRGQMADLMCSSFCNTLRYHHSAMQSLLNQIRIEHPDEAQVADLEHYIRLIDQAATSSPVPADGGWVARSSATIEDLLRFGLASRINTGKIENRFIDLLRSWNQSLHDCLALTMPEVARQLGQFKELDAEARRRQLPALSTNEPRIADLRSLPDTVLAAQRKQQVTELVSHRGDVWQSLKGDTARVSDWIEQLAREHPGEPSDTDMIALHALLVAARKAAKDKSRPDWDDAVRSATLPIIAFAIHARVLARVTHGPFKEQLWNLGLWLKDRLPKQLDKAFLASARMEAMEAEMSLRGIARER